jgi:protein involved in polysaccharide export with SLBB domain
MSVTLEGALPFMLAITGTAGGLLGRYIGSRVDRRAREKAEIELARIKLENDKLIEAIRSIEGRRSTEEDLGH